MIVALVIGVVFLSVVAGLLASMRSTRLKRLAYTLHLRYDSHVDYVVTEDAANQVQFFKHGQHHFCHVLTFQDSKAFVRVCDDKIFSDSSFPLAVYTIVSAELTRGTFTPFILAPRQKEDANPSSNLPEKLAHRFTLKAPEGYQLPETVIGFLKASGPCYLELTANTLIYCEFNVTPVAQIQSLRFRVMQLLKELVQLPQNPVVPSDPQATFTTYAPGSAMSNAELQAEMLLKLQASSRTSPSVSGGGMGRIVFALIWLFLVLGILIFANYALRHWVAR